MSAPDLSGKESGYGLFALTFGPGGAHADPGRFSAYTFVQQPVRDYTLSDPDPALPSRGASGGTQGAAAPDLSGLARGLARLNAQMREFHETFGSLRNGVGSNNWGVDAAHSANGRAMVANDPHLLLPYPPLWHVIAMTAGDGSVFNVAGFQFPGEPGIIIGRGAHVAWGLTNVSYDVMDLYRETLTDCGHPPPLVCTSVEFRNTSGATINVPIVPQPYTITVAGGSTVPALVLVVPHHGPIVDYESGATTGTAISMRWTGHEGNTQDLKAVLDIAVATSVGDDTTAPGTAFAAIKNWTISAENYVVVDDQGNVGFDPHGLVPLRNWISTTKVPWFPLPGNIGTAEWGRTAVGDTSCAANPAPADCWVPDALLPRGVNPAKGYFVTANGDPAGYTDDGNPVGNLIGGTLYPYLSFDWDDPTGIRPGRVTELLKAKATSAEKVSLEDMQAIQSDHAMLLARLFEDRNFYPATTGAPAAYATGRAVLSAWASAGYDCPTGLSGSDPKSAAVTDATVLSQSAGCLLFHTFFVKLLHTVFDDDFAVISATTGVPTTGDPGAEVRALFNMLSTANTRAFCDDVSTSFALVAQKTCEQQVIDALASAVGTLQNAYGTDTKTWLWGRVHTLTTESPAAPLIAGTFSAGPYARHGGIETVDVGNPMASQSSSLAFAYDHGSSMRFIAVMDPAAPSAQVKMQLPGPERDAPAVLSSSLNLLNMYVQNQYFDFLYGHQVDNKGLPTQRFTP